ncbi:hypothetical protein K1T71_001663 [Dendrolimus kikuchii]|uniref:Uncharacterized protein n=1 Tax=Dendrolimus kikuchii TaxID=765133 RepID=A0ACC1DEC0_9NEOP|nr:hypothetical protein K1T71_001663 [Dendrolimus kikuchii]
MKENSTYALCIMAGNETDDGVQVLRVLDDHKYELDEEKLRKILLQPSVKDCPVAVVSVAGTYRTGKSFLLDFFLRYCKATPYDRENNKWLGSENETLEGFKWRGGSEKATNGIQLWPEPIHMTLPSGKKVVVILMDTQGTFDSQSTVKDCSTIFALSTLLSSVQIYNIVGNIKEYDLQHLELFTRYGILAQDDNDTPFQVLQFLVRDWMSPYEHPYGVAGGNVLLDKRLEVHENQHPDLRTLREHIRSCFEKVTCFLMPHPGFSIANPTFRGHLADLQPEFKEGLKELVPQIFETYLTQRIINGAELKARDLYDYFKTYTSIFSGNALPEPVTILQATSAVTLVLASRDANETYEKYMDDEFGTDKPSSTTGALKDKHIIAIETATEIFNTKKQLDPEAAQKELTRLREDWAARLLQFIALNKAKVESAINKAKAKYDKIVYRNKSLEAICLHPVDLEIDHKDAFQAALKIFDEKRAQNLGNDPEREQLVKELQENLAKLQRMNDQNNNSFVNEAVNLYNEHMNKAFGHGNCMATELFDAKHSEGLEKAVQYFVSKRNRYQKRENDNYINLLNQKIQDQCVKLRTGNNNANKTAIQTALYAYNNYISSIWMPQFACMHPDDLQEEHENAMERAIDELNNCRESNDDIEDSAKNQLIKRLRSRYNELRDSNQAANTAAVDAAFGEYRRQMDSKCGPSLLSILVVPWVIKVLALMPDYHQKSKSEAMRVFKNKRRPSNKSSDQYLRDLESRISDAFESYKDPIKSLAREVGIPVD